MVKLLLPPADLIASPASGGGRRITILAVVVGIVCRAGQFLSRQSYWRDESALLLNVIRKPLRVLPFTPLDVVYHFTQAAPPLFLLALKATIRLWGLNEYGTRLIPFAAGVLSVPLFAVVSCRLIPGRAAAWATCFFALSHNLIFQAATVKPYSSDVLAALLMVYVAFCRRGRSAPAARLASTALVASVLFWVSYSSIFVFASISLSLIPLVLRQRRGALLFVLAQLPAALSFSAVFLLCMRPQHDATLHSLWLDRFVDYGRPWSVPAWAVMRLWELFDYSLWPVGGLLLIPAALAAREARRRLPPEIFRLLTLPFLLSFIAAAVHQYPFGGNRLNLYLVPFELMLAGLGIETVAAQLAGTPRLAWLGVWGAVGATAAAWAAVALVAPRSMGNSRGAIAFLREHRQLDEPAYVLRGTSEDVEIYWPGSDPLVHLQTPFDVRPSESSFWVVTADKPGPHKETQDVLHQPGCVEDHNLSRHGRGFDVVLFHRVRAASGGS